jgi:hypothetical protein
MKRIGLAFAMVWAGTAACHAQPFLTEEGLAPVVLGMNVQAAEKALGVKLLLQIIGDEDPDAAPGDTCGYARRADGMNPEVSYMVLGEIITRIDIDRVRADSGRVGEGAPITTAEGFGVGSLETDIRASYGSRLSVEPHHYTDEGHYLILDSPNHQRGILFETYNGRVSRFRAGTYPSLGFVEGCL